VFNSADVAGVNLALSDSGLRRGGARGVERATLG
jgi:hypothetical protein